MKSFGTRLFLTFIVLTALSYGHAHAQCTVPNGVAGEQFYNTTHNVMQYCNGSDWVNMGGIGGGGAGLPGGCTNDQVAKWNGAAWVCAADDAGGGGGSDTLAGLSCSTNQIAKWNGTAWVCAADETGGGGAGCAGGWAHMQIWRTGNWPIVSCGVDGHLRQCQNGLVVTLATAPQDCGGG